MKPPNRSLLFLIFSLSFVFACNTVRFALEGTPTPISLTATTIAVTTNSAETPIPTAPPPTTDTNTPEPIAPATAIPLATVAAAQPTWLPPAPPIAPFSAQTITSDQQTTFTELHQAIPPKRDDIALAISYNNIPVPSPAPDTPNNITLTPGTERTFNVLNIDTNTISQINTVLLAVGEHAYFWFDTGPGSFQPDESDLALVAAEFDLIYDDVTFYFGPEGQPGIDGDLRVHVINASPLVLCAVTLETASNCGLSGYFSAADGLPAAINGNSNERDMFVMNVDNFGPGYYLSVLGHEFRHMIEDHYDVGDWDWEVEGSATLAMDLLGIEQGAAQRANWFLSEPDQQLNSWPRESATTPGYGQGFLMNRYLFDRLGVDAYRQFATSPLPGFFAVDAVAEANGLSLTGESLWLDWLVALAIHRDPEAPDLYHFGTAGLDTVAMTRLNNAPREINATVHQYASDYYDLNGNGATTIQFAGDTLVPLFEITPASGEWMWLANRGNYSDMRLTRTVDLTAVDHATLFYETYYDIEPGYDFAYVAASADGGQTWTGLVATQMQDAAADPSNSAYTARFYTGESDNWVQEQIDLSPYAGQIIQLRFQYITDPILTHPGIAFDNIAIPEIGFFDDAETVADGWLAEGFHRVTAYMPQTWHVQLITFAEETVSVQPLTLATDQTGTITLNLDNSRGRVIIIVAASAPATLELGHYRLIVNP
ncbi:MAG: hypothetical protein V9G20_06275 [Candidatus Promineifilaceae bacterium]